MMTALVDDTYAEAFRSLYAEVLITARDRKWLDHAVHAATGNASSTIMCDCEAGLDRYVGPGGDETFPTPDNRPGALVQFHVPRFRKDRVEALERSLLVRLSQNVLTCPTARAFSLMDTPDWLPIGRKIAYFGDRHQFKDERDGRRVWVIPILGGEFWLDRRFGYTDGLMGGNLWLMGDSVDSALLAAERGHEAAMKTPGVICPFPGGLAGSGSKAGSSYKFTIASTYAVMEIILNGKDLATLVKATQAAIVAARTTPGLIRVSAGNYGGRLGKSFIYLDPAKQPANAG
jgi:formylmethanofuran--tetrahydromethanopterin N-formyltransferase